MVDFSKSEYIQYFYWTFISTVGVIGLFFITLQPTDTHALSWTLWGFFWGVFYALGLFFYFSKSENSQGHAIFWLLLVYTIHIACWFADPVLENDFYRYAFDGRNIRMGIHPYQYTPKELISKNKTPDYAQKINFKEYRTIYPPLVEMLFCSEWLVPDTVWGWHIFILLAAFLLVFCFWFFFRKAKLSKGWFFFAIIFLNPLYLKEGLNSKHFDFFAMVAILYSGGWTFYKGKAASSVNSFLFALLCGIRPWYLCFLLWYGSVWKLKNWCFFAGFFLVPWAILLLWPGLPPLAETLNSWKEFVKDWEFNAIIYDFVLRAVESREPDDLQASYLARKICWGLGFGLIGLIYLFTRKKTNVLVFWHVGFDRLDDVPAHCQCLVFYAHCCRLNDNSVFRRI